MTVDNTRVKDEEEEITRWLSEEQGDSEPSQGGAAQDAGGKNKKSPDTKKKRYWDDASGEELPEREVIAARMEELEFMQNWDGGVWVEVPTQECIDKTGRRPIGGRWVDHNKGDNLKMNVRSRWVAQEVARDRSNEFFAATPPLEALRMLLSSCATHAPRGERRKLLFIDVRKAHLHARSVRDIYVALPPEISRPGYCAKLRRCLYGTRDAPKQWEALYTSVLGRLGFKQGVASASCFYNAERRLRCVVHGDDFTFEGGRGVEVGPRGDGEGVSLQG